MLTEVNPLQPEKTPGAIFVTELGIVTEVKPRQPEKADSPITVTEFGIIVFLHPAINVFVDFSIIALQLSRESYFELRLSTNICSKPSQLEKAPLPISVTELGIVTKVKLLQL